MDDHRWKKANTKMSLSIIRSLDHTPVSFRYVNVIIFATLLLDVHQTVLRYLKQPLS
jgi:hypothetical protein